jgi:hypothetical protein
MAEHCVRTARQHGGHRLCMIRRGAVADGVHPAVKSEEAAGLHAVVDGGRREPSAAQLRARHDAVLLGSEHRDRGVIT